MKFRENRENVKPWRNYKFSPQKETGRKKLKRFYVSFRIVFYHGSSNAYGTCVTKANAVEDDANCGGRGGGAAEEGGKASWARTTG